MRSEQQIADRKWKEQSLAAGYATQWDRQTARTIRQRQADGIEVSAEQVKFAERVERIVGSER